MRACLFFGRRRQSLFQRQKRRPPPLRVTIQARGRAGLFFAIAISGMLKKRQTCPAIHKWRLSENTVAKRSECAFPHFVEVLSTFRGTHKWRSDAVCRTATAETWKMWKVGRHFPRPRARREKKFLVDGRSFMVP